MNKEKIPSPILIYPLYLSSYLSMGYWNYHL